jgi:hypothetical protein
MGRKSRGIFGVCESECRRNINTYGGNMNKEYYENNKERLAKYKHEWYERNKEKRSLQEKERYIKNKKRIIERVKRYRKERLQNDVSYRILSNLRHRCSQAILHEYKSESTITLLGAPIEVVISHLESLFTEGMTWDNYGFGDGKWHIDHIKPCYLFDLTDVEQQKQCFHYTNLQPLWQKDNLKKNKYYDMASTAPRIV